MFLKVGGQVIHKCGRGISTKTDSPAAVDLESFFDLSKFCKELLVRLVNDASDDAQL
jgi:hypothetical protein